MTWGGSRKGEDRSAAVQAYHSWTKFLSDKNPWVFILPAVIIRDFRLLEKDPQCTEPLVAGFAQGHLIDRLDMCLGSR